MVLADSFYYQPVQIDTINTRVNADLFAKEGDANGRGMVVQITENGIIKDTTGITLRLQWSHISVGVSGFTDFEVVDATKGLYKLVYPTSMLHRGRVEAFIRITDNGILSGTRNLLITVERMVGSDETIEAADDFSALQTALTRLSAWEATISGKVDTWEADMEATKQLYIDTLAATEAGYPQELVSLQGQLAETNAQVDLLNRGLGETFATLVALQTAYPTGDTKDHIVAASGHRYYWSGSAWADGGAYQAVEVMNGSITPQKTNFIIKGKNLFDKSKATSGYRIAASGILIADAGFNLSDYIPVNPATNYYRNGSTFVLGFYDANKNFLSAVTTLAFTTPANCCYVRAVLVPTQMDALQIELGTSGTTYEAYKEFLSSSYIKSLILNDITTENGNLKTLLDGFTNDVNSIESKLNKMTKIVNLFDTTTKALNFRLVPTTGKLVSGRDFYTSDFIQVSGLSNYSFSKIWYIAYYDIEKAWVGGVNIGNASNYTITTPDECAYLRFSYWATTQSVHETIMVNSGSTLLSYIPYDYYTYTGNVFDSVNNKKLSDTITKYETNFSNLTPILSLNLPATIYGVVDKELNIYFDNIMEFDYKKYDFDVTCTIGKHQSERWTCVPSTAGTYPLTIDVYTNNIKLTTKTINVIVKAATVGNNVNKKLLIIGDSTTDHGTGGAGYVTAELLNLFGVGDTMDVTLLGTRGVSPNLHEGRSGWNALKFTTLASSGGVTNAFYNGGFDFSYYMAQQGYTGVDYVVINLGINDLFSFTTDATANAEITNVLSRYQTMIDSIRAYNATVKIVVALTIPPSYSQDSFAHEYGNGQTRWRYKRNNQLWVRALIAQFGGKEGQYIYLLPLNTNIDTVNNMSTETVAINSRNSTTTVRQSNGVHPNIPGYNQIADVYYYFLKSFEV